MKILGVGIVLWEDISSFIGRDPEKAEYLKQKTYGLVCEYDDRYIVIHNEVQDEVPERDFTMIPKVVVKDVKIFSP